MASGQENIATRMMARIRRFMGVTSSAEISDSRRSQKESIHYGMFSEDELRHVDGILNAYDPKKGQKKSLNENDINNFLVEISSQTRKKMDEIKNLRILAPEIDQAKSIIVSSIMSPADLQTDSVSIAVDHPGLTAETNGKIGEYLTTYFNDEYHLGPKIAEWIGCAGFEDGSKAILVLPKNEIDVLNTVADQWNPDQKKEFQELKKTLHASTESLCGMSTESHSYKKIEAVVESFAQIALEDNKIGSDFLTDEEKKSPKFKNADTKTTAELARTLTENSFKLLRTSEAGDAVVVTRDISALGKLERDNETRIDELQKEAERQIRGFKIGSNGESERPSFPVLSITDVVKVGDNDLPIVIELPADAVVPVCAPHDHKNHIGYYVLLDENGQPCRGQYAFGGGITSDVNNRLATNAAKAVYGGAAISAYTQAGMTNAQAIDQMTQIFSCAVNHLLRDKLSKDGLNGLDVHVHEAVGKSLFFNLLAKNKIKMVFVPAPMMVYYRFLHREDGTGKTFLEDIAYILALRCTLMIAKIMAQIDNATLHRRIEINVDEKNQNPVETLEQARHTWLNKKVPQFSTDPTTAAEGILNSHLSIVPKGLVGNTDDLSITTEKSYGNSQAPDNEILENLNNWVCQGLKLPPSALNQLNETEYAKSVATSNLFFSNAVRGWQNVIKPFNKKFIMNYILCNDQMLEDIRKIIAADKNGSVSKATMAGGVTAPDSDKEVQSADPANDEKVEEALKRVVATAEVVLAPPNMSTSKAHFDEVQAQADAVDKILGIIYPDDVAPNDELKNLMGSVRAIIASKVMREFLPKLGFHDIADVPSLEEVSADDSAKCVLRLGQIKRRMDALAKLQSGQLLDQDPNGGDLGGTDSGTGEDTGSSGGEAGDDIPDLGGDNEFKI